MDEGANSPNRQTGNGSVSAQATTLRVESGFDRSGTTQGFAFFNPAAPGPGSDDNFDDPATTIVNGKMRVPVTPEKRRASQRSAA